MKDSFVDPEYERWYRKYPSFPGVAKCVELLRCTNAKGAWIDIICQELQQHAETDAADLIDATGIAVEQNYSVTPILLQILGEAKIEDALPLFNELLETSHEYLRPYAIDGLKQLDTKEARRLLWQYNSQQLDIGFRNR